MINTKTLISTSMYIEKMNSENNIQKFNLVISDDKKKNFEITCQNLTKSIIYQRKNPSKINHVKLNKNRKVILEKLDNIQKMVDEMIKLEDRNLEVLTTLNNGQLVEHFNLIKFTGSALRMFEKWVNDAKKAFTDIIDAAQDFARDAAATIEDVTTQAYNTAKGAVQKTFNDALKQATGLINDAKDIAVDIYNDASDAVMDTVNTVKDGAISIVNEVYEGLETAWSAVTDTFYMLAGALTDFVGDIGSMGERLLKGLSPSKVKRKNIKDGKTKANMENSPHKIPLDDSDEELTSADISTNTLISKEASANIKEMGITVKEIEYNQKTADDNLDSTIKDINELNIPGIEYNDAEWNKTKSMDGNIGECTPGTCLESFTDTQNNLKPFNYFNNYSLF